MTDPPQRVNFIDGRLLTAADLVAEQEYHRGMRYLHNRLHGYGTVSGLEVAVSGEDIEVGPGLAIDVLGREIVLAAPLALHLEPHRKARRWVRDLCILWQEVPAGPLPEPGPDGVVIFSRWVEQPELGLAAPGRAAPEALVLARLTRTDRGAVEVDASVRRPLGPV